jgi:hypothetical protein
MLNARGVLTNVYRDSIISLPRYLLAFPLLTRGTMKFNLAFVALIASTIATSLESDKLANLGLENLREDVAKNPASYSKTCTERTVSRRREWYEAEPRGRH